MRARIFVLMNALVIATALLAWPETAGAQGRSRGGGGGGGGGSRVGTAAPRGGGGGGRVAAPRGGGATAPRGGGQATAPARAGTGTRTSTGGSYGVAVAPDQGRPRQGQPVQGQAVPRAAGPGVRPPYGGHYPYYPYYPYYGYYPYGYFGLGYFYYDPFWGDYPYGWYGYPSVYQAHDGEENGGLKLRVKPREAEVYVDGNYVGQVRDFDGAWDKLELEAGTHRIEIRAAGYEPLVVELQTLPGRTVTYRGELEPARK